ncbi:hypothetical protein BELL_1115g00020 [Botrytis elliptica]|uniref:Uncharacterized protein n=1 Tax=Botrytis elliptica TaxID=278938 RepID=A0A4Z1IM07_9HELO|nr:hypothetical protein EAE99_010413 [Botrytis elliptica]TGO62436.1 hypothetical protein BELL_1115g00020 [Botrytis elliptica]
MEKDSKSSPMNPDIKLVTIDVKMQIRTLHAKIMFLQEVGGITTEIEKMMTELTALCNKGESISTIGTPAPAATKVFPKLLAKPETMQAHSGYVGPNSTHLLMMPGDTIIAHAYIDEMIAVGFNTRTNLGGRFPVNNTKSVDPQPNEKVEMFIATDAPSTYNCGPLPLTYKTGHYVRVCSWEKSKLYAYGFNLSTFAMGRFDVRYSFKRIEGLWE